jgi:CheY-like chemotaxis protein
MRKQRISESGVNLLKPIQEGNEEVSVSESSSFYESPVDGDERQISNRQQQISELDEE